jgi:hypothetical protein
MKKIKYALAALLITTLVVGCGLITGSFTFGYEIDGTITSTNASLEYEYIDLTTIEDYNNHRDDLHSLDNIAIVGCFTNNGTEPISGEIWLAYDTTYALYGADGPDSVRANATRIYMTHSPIINGVLLCVDWEDGLAFIEGFPEIQTAVLDSAYLVIYGLGDADEFNVEMDIDIIFTCTGGL